MVCACVKEKLEEQTLLVKPVLQWRDHKALGEKKVPCSCGSSTVIHRIFMFNCSNAVSLLERRLLPDYSCDVDLNEE